jgi:hypothetical protein
MSAAPRIRTEPLSFQERRAYQLGREAGENAVRFGLQLWWLVFGVLIGVVLGLAVGFSLLHR